MSLQCGIVGLPNVGKSTLFNCLSNAKAQSANFPFCTIEPNVGVITVPDERLNKLAELVHPQRIVPTTVRLSTSPDWSKEPAKAKVWEINSWRTSGKPMQSCMYCVASTMTTLPTWTERSIRYATRKSSISNSN